LNSAGARGGNIVHSLLFIHSEHNEVEGGSSPLIIYFLDAHARLSSYDPIDPVEGSTLSLIVSFITG
jgi:hypothetical protein